MMEEKRYMNVKQVCEYLGISQSFLRKLIREEKILYSRAEGKILLEKSQVDKWIEARQCGNIEPACDTQNILNIK